MKHHKIYSIAGYICIAFALCSCSSLSGPQKEKGNMEDKAPPVVEKSIISNMPVPAHLLENPLPSSAEGLDNPALEILDWAGYEAAATYSYDDGQPSHLDHWEALKATGVPMTWYLWTGVGGSARYDAVWKDALANGHEVANHTRSHKRISEYASDKAIVKDIDDCATYLRERIGLEETPSFAYPFGETQWKNYFDRASDGEGNTEARFLLARTVRGGRVQAKSKIDPLLLPIFSVDGNHNEKDFIRELDTALNEKSWTIFMFHSILPGDNWYAGVSLESILISLSHAQHGQKTWLDTVEAIGSYWFAARIFREITPVAHNGGLRWEWELPATFNSGHYLRASIAGGKLFQNGEILPQHKAGFYEIALDTGSLEWQP